MPEDPTNAARQRRWRERQAERLPPAVRVPCETCPAMHTGKYGLLCQRCWLRLAPEGRAEVSARVQRSKVRYVLHPGHVISANDGQEHFISGPCLAGLYGLDIRSQNVVLGDRRRRRDLPGDVHLYPRFDGDYRLPASDCRAGAAEQGEAAGIKQSIDNEQ